MTVPHMEVLTEEPSMEAFLEVLLPRLLPQATFAIHSFQNKQNLLKKLATRLRAYESGSRTTTESRCSSIETEETASS